MCLSTVIREKAPEEVIMEYVSMIRINGDRITLTDVMGLEKTVTGRLTMADLTGAVVRIDVSEDTDAAI